ncbi:ribosomal protein S6 [Pyronema domesticum]|uniref:Small ribosomal subunit protein bS6m n=1 Tax=Pyronema omphalodes (strain CBS 100304) TaxID=1076935 RepID=U4L924_PYROM|nr:ribosomal protein S6 [Pyronema domesticum]CCX14385.1 Similar to 37S ribosomal protein MRP17, mitochondrial; acc. no. P28778 [Pyronema omphalodes CBS 100304]
MLYELIACVRPNTIAEVREIAKACGMAVLNGGGVVRSIKNWDTQLLPRRTRKHQTYYDRGHYFLMRFDSNAGTQQNLRDVLGLDPRMVKFSVVKVGSKLEEIVQKEEN